MASPALTAFGEAIDATALSARQKDDVKALGQRLYLASIKEHVGHVSFHLEAEVIERGATPEVESMAAIIRAILTRAVETTDALALVIADGLR